MIIRPSPIGNRAHSAPLTTAPIAPSPFRSTCPSRSHTVHTVPLAAGTPDTDAHARWGCTCTMGMHMGSTCTASRGDAAQWFCADAASLMTVTMAGYARHATTTQPTRSHASRRTHPIHSWSIIHAQVYVTGHISQPVATHACIPAKLCFHKPMMPHMHPYTCLPLPCAHTPRPGHLSRRHTEAQLHMSPRTPLHTQCGVEENNSELMTDGWRALRAVNPRSPCLRTCFD